MKKFKHKRVMNLEINLEIKEFGQLTLITFAQGFT